MALSSIEVSREESSMKKLDSRESLSAASRMSCQCLAGRVPSAMACMPIPAFEQTSLRESWSADISRLKKPTAPWDFAAICSAMLSARVVFPTEGLAAMITSSPPWSPVVILSSMSKPVERPVT